MSSILIVLLAVSLAFGFQREGTEVNHNSARRLHLESAHTLNVKQFQARGDGHTDDTSAFVSALAKLAKSNGGALLIPSGTYPVGDIRIGSNVTIKGIGSPLPILVKTPRASSILDISSKIVAGSRTMVHDVAIEDLTLRGRSVEQGFSEHVHNVIVLGVAGLHIHHVRFEAFQGDGMCLGTRLDANEPLIHNSDVVIANSTFDGINYENRNGISIIDCTHCMVERNSFTHLTRPDMPGAIDIEPDHRDEDVRDITIRSNIVLDSHGSSGGIEVSLNFKDFQHDPGAIRIAKNEIRNVTHGLTVLWLGGQPSAHSPPLGIVIRDNRVQDVGHGLILDGVSGITLTGNRFFTVRQDIQLGPTMGVFGVTFVNNYFQNVGTDSRHGIVIFGPAANLQFQRNSFRNLGSSEEDGSAIYFAHNHVTAVSFVGNRFFSRKPFADTVVRTGDASLDTRTSVWENNILESRMQIGVFPSTKLKARTSLNY